jgi:MarR family transcriptional regulator, lower aerobic nicotinate degradation pathway regulator
MADNRPTADTDPVIDGLVQLTWVVTDALAAATAGHDISLTQLRLLGMLRDRSPSMAAIADRLKLDRSSVSGLIDRAERRGLVARRTSTEDARVTLIDRTDAGEALTATLASSVSARLEELLQKVPPADRITLVRIAELITD